MQFMTFVCYKQDDYLLLCMKKTLKNSSITQHFNSIITKQNTLLSRYIQKENKEAAVIQLLAELKGNSF